MIRIWGLSFDWWDAAGVALMLLCFGAVFVPNAMLGVIGLFACLIIATTLLNRSRTMRN